MENIDQVENIIKHQKQVLIKDKKMIQSSELIDEIINNTHLNSTDAYSAFSMLINSIKNHLLKDNVINLGDLGILSTTISDSTENEKAVSFTACSDFKNELSNRQTQK